MRNARKRKREKFQKKWPASARMAPTATQPMEKEAACHHTCAAVFVNPGSSTVGAHKAKGVRRQSLAGALASWLLMVAFIAIAAWQAVALAQVLANLTRSMAWQAVPAVVLNVELTSDSVKSTSPSVEDGIVFGAEGRYTYTYDGKPYTGHRLSFAQGQDNSAWHTSLWAELQSARTAGRTIPV